MKNIAEIFHYMNKKTLAANSRLTTDKRKIMEEMHDQKFRGIY
jgi:hypothetical protein